MKFQIKLRAISLFFCSVRSPAEMVQGWELWIVDYQMDA